MAAEIITHEQTALGMYSSHPNTAAFLRKAASFMTAFKVPDTARNLLFWAFAEAKGFDQVVLLVRQIGEIMRHYESCAVALRFGAGLPPSMIKELREEIDGIKENACRWLRETADELRIGGVEQALEDVKQWFEWMNKQPNKSQIELECQSLVEHMRSIPADNYSF